MLVAQVVFDQFTGIDVFLDLAAWVIESLLGTDAREAALEEVRPVGRDPVLASKGPAGSVAVSNAEVLHQRGSRQNEV